MIVWQSRELWFVIFQCEKHMLYRCIDVTMMCDFKQKRNRHAYMLTMPCFGSKKHVTSHRKSINALKIYIETCTQPTLKGEQIRSLFHPYPNNFFFPKAQLSDAVTFDGRSGWWRCQGIRLGGDLKIGFACFGWGGCFSPPLLPVKMYRDKKYINIIWCSNYLTVGQWQVSVFSKFSVCYLVNDVNV